MKEPFIIKSFSSQDITSIKAKTTFGGIKILGHADSEIRVEVRGKSFVNFWASQERIKHELDKYQLNAVQQANTLILEVGSKTGEIDWLNMPLISITIYVPQTVAFETELKTKGGKIVLQDIEGNHYFDTKAGEVELINVKGEIRGRTLMGTIDAQNCKAKMDISTAAGTIEVVKSEGDMTFSTSAGTIELYNLTGNINATTSAGTIETDNISGSLKVSTSAGSIEIKAMYGSLSCYSGAGSIEAEVVKIGDFIDLETDAGRITMSMPTTEGLNLDIEGSSIKNAYFPNFQGSQSHNRIFGKSNGGGKSVRLRSRQGRISINARQKGSFQTFSKSLKESQFTLPSNFFKQNAEGVLLSLSICIILTYGFSSIVYFTIELFNKNNPFFEVYKGVFINNIAKGFTAFISIFIFTRYFEDKIEKNWLKYVVLVVFICLTSLVADFLVGIFYWQFVERTTLSNDAIQSNFLVFYGIIPPIVACIYFFLWQRSRQINRKISDQEFQLANLEKLKTKAELDALQARINPHFLYNSLNSIAGLVHENPDKAEQMTLLLSKLFRHTTGTKDQHFNTIKNELEIVKTYLDIEKVRFGERLSYFVDVDEALKEKEIPCFLLQPIVENAIKHGISKIATQGEIHVEIKQENGFLKLAVHDNGPAFSDNFFTGYGLQSIQDKLKLLYGNKAQLDIQNNNYKQVIIKLPC